MFPISIVNQYGNEVPKPVIVQDVISFGNLLTVLSSSGKLYTCGSFNATGYGAVDTSWFLQRSDVMNVWGSPVGSALLIQTYTNEFYYNGINPFTTSVSYATYSKGWVNCTSTFTDAFDIGTIRKIQMDIRNVVVLLTDGTIWSAGTNLSGIYGTGTASTGSNSFVQSTTTSMDGMVIDIILGSSSATGTNPDHTMIAYTNVNSIYGVGKEYNGEFTSSSGTSGLVQSSWKRVATSVTDYQLMEAQTLLIKHTSTGSWYQRGTNRNFWLGDNWTAGGGGHSSEYQLQVPSSSAGIYGKRWLSKQSGGYTSFYTGTDGALYSASANNYGQAGYGNGTASALFLNVPGWNDASIIKKIEVISFNSYILTNGGLLYYAGRNLSTSYISPGMPTTGQVNTFTLLKLPI